MHQDNVLVWCIQAALRLEVVYVTRCSFVFFPWILTAGWADRPNQRFYTFVTSLNALRECNENDVYLYQSKSNLFCINEGRNKGRPRASMECIYFMLIVIRKIKSGWAGICFWKNEDNYALDIHVSVDTTQRKSLRAPYDPLKKYTQ